MPCIPNEFAALRGLHVANSGRIAKKARVCTQFHHSMSISCVGADVPTTTCARCTGNGSTLGPLGKRWRVGADPAPGWDNIDLPDLPKSKTLAVSESASPLWPGSTRNEEKSEKQKVRKSENWRVGKSESRKLSRNTCSEGGNEAEYCSAVLATLIHTFYTLNR